MCLHFSGDVSASLFSSVFQLNCHLTLKLMASSRAAGEGPGEAEGIIAAFMWLI